MARPGVLSALLYIYIYITRNLQGRVKRNFPIFNPRDPNLNPRDPKFNSRDLTFIHCVLYFLDFTVQNRSHWMRIEIPYRTPVFLRLELAYEVDFDKRRFLFIRI